MIELDISSETFPETGQLTAAAKLYAYNLRGLHQKVLVSLFISGAFLRMACMSFTY
jgi:hypothetical protein